MAAGLAAMKIAGPLCRLSEVAVGGDRRGSPVTRRGNGLRCGIRTHVTCRVNALGTGLHVDVGTHPSGGIQFDNGLQKTSVRLQPDVDKHGVGSNLACDTIRTRPDTRDRGIPQNLLNDRFALQFDFRL